jgi:hypothetical protein
MSDKRLEKVGKTTLGDKFLVKDGDEVIGKAVSYAQKVVAFVDGVRYESDSAVSLEDKLNGR